MSSARSRSSSVDVKSPLDASLLVHKCFSHHLISGRDEQCLLTECIPASSKFRHQKGLRDFQRLLCNGILHIWDFDYTDSFFFFLEVGGGSPRCLNFECFLCVKFTFSVIKWKSCDNACSYRGYLPYIVTAWIIMKYLVPFQWKYQGLFYFYFFFNQCSSDVKERVSILSHLSKICMLY